MRLDRLIAQSTELSRSQANKMLRYGLVKVNGNVIKQASYAVADTDAVSLEGDLLERPRHRYLMLNKPQGVVCATEDAEHETVLDLLPYECHIGNLGQLHPAGRLDIDTTGLVLISSDGQWTHRVTSPKHLCWKQYQVTLADPVTDHQKWITAFAAGLELRGEKAATAPAEIEFDCDDEVIVRIREGRYHQVKRMVAAMGDKVIRLHRDRIGDIELDTDLPEGEMRELTDVEVAAFMPADPAANRSAAKTKAKT